MKNEYADISQNSYENKDKSQNTTFEMVVEETPNIDKEEPSDKNLLYSFVNDSDKDMHIKGRFNAILKPGMGIIVRQEGSINKTEASSRLPMYGNGDDYDTIRTKGTRTATTFTKITEWLSRERELLALAEHKINRLSNELELKNNEIQELTFTRKREAELFTYGFVPYLMFFIVSLAILIISGTLYVVWRLTNVTIFNPATTIMFMVMAFGWSVTAYYGLISVRKRSSKS